MSNLNDVVKIEIYRQVRRCADLYKPIFATLSRGQSPAVSEFTAEVIGLYEMLAPFIEEKKDESKFKYLEKTEALKNYVSNPMKVYLEIYYRGAVKLNDHNPYESDLIGRNRAHILQRFESARQALSQFAHELGVTDIESINPKRDIGATLDG